jgi:CHASE3 domain sensor protein
MTTATPHRPHMSALRHPLHALGDETRVLLEIERAGDQPESLLVAMAMVATVLLPILATILVLAFGAAWIFG